MNSKKWLVAAVAVGLSIFAILLRASTTMVLGVGGLPHTELVDGPAEVTFRQFTSMPGEMGGWHSHPGSVFNVVTSGALTVEDGCGDEETFTAGQAFEQTGGRVHRWKNLGSVPEVEFNTFVVPQGGGLAIALTERRCGPPRSMTECRADGWRAFDFPHSFVDQGDCVKYVRRHR